jgi:hypothetical protein
MAIIELLPHRYFVGIWFVGDGTKDWLGVAFRDHDIAQENNWGPWKIRYRFRYYREEDAFGDKDLKNIYSGQAKPETPEKEIEAMMQTVATFASLQFGKIDYLPLHTENHEFIIDALSKVPWAHMKKMTDVSKDQ